MSAAKVVGQASEPDGSAMATEAGAVDGATVASAAPEDGDSAVPHAATTRAAEIRTNGISRIPDRATAPWLRDRRVRRRPLLLEVADEPPQHAREPRTSLSAGGHDLL